MKHTGNSISRFPIRPVLSQYKQRNFTHSNNLHYLNQPFNSSGNLRTTNIVFHPSPHILINILAKPNRGFFHFTLNISIIALYFSAFGSGISIVVSSINVSNCAILLFSSTRNVFTKPDALSFFISKSS